MSGSTTPFYPVANFPGIVSQGGATFGPETAILNQYSVNARTPRAWPTPGAVAVFDPSVIPPGTYMETVPGWSYAGNAPTGQFKVNNAGGSFDVTAATPNLAYKYDTGYRSHYIEAVFPAISATSFPLAIRIVDQNNWIGARIDTNQILHIYQCVAGTLTMLYQISASGGVLDIGSTIKLEARGDDTWHVYCAGTDRKSVV